MGKSDHLFTICWIRYAGEDFDSCSPSCSFSSYESPSGCRINASDGKRHPTLACPGENNYKLAEVPRDKQ
jgi:hypothetical protein